MEEIVKMLSIQDTYFTMHEIDLENKAMQVYSKESSVLSNSAYFRESVIWTAVIATQTKFLRYLCSATENM